MRLLTIIAVILAATACTTVPEQIQGTYRDVSPTRVEPGVIGSTVRWGGVILHARNDGDGTCFEILSRDLDKHLRPEIEDFTAGRFIACKQGFHDPEVFARGREVTLTGQIRSIEVRPLGDVEYRYPVVDVEDLVLWQKRKTVVVYDHHPAFAGPFWGWGHPYWVWGHPYWGWGHPWYGHWGTLSRTTARTRTLLPDPSIIESRN